MKANRNGFRLVLGDVSMFKNLEDEIHTKTSRLNLKTFKQKKKKNCFQNISATSRIVSFVTGLLLQCIGSRSIYILIAYILFRLTEFFRHTYFRTRSRTLVLAVRTPIDQALRPHILPKKKTRTKPCAILIARVYYYYTSYNI